MAPEIDEPDEQDQSEVFDEESLDANDSAIATTERKTFEELPDVFDVTSAVGDADDDQGLVGEDLDDEEIADIEADETLADFEDDSLAGRMPEAVGRDDDEGDNRLYLDALPEGSRPGEVDLIYAADTDGVEEDRAGAQGLEAKQLSDDDIALLGYARAGGEPGTPGHFVRFEVIVRNRLWALLREGVTVREYGHADRAIHEAMEIARELSRSGEPARVFLQAAADKTIEVVDMDSSSRKALQERSAVVPGRSSNG
jgi:hypothetical protein